MMNVSVATRAAALAVSALFAQSAFAQGKEPPSVPPGKLFTNDVVNITSPNSEGWKLLAASPGQWTFKRLGTEADETFVAQLQAFRPPQTDAPEAFEAEIVKGTAGDVDRRRFKSKVFEHRFVSERGYPCVQVDSVAEDSQARLPSGRTGLLVLQSRHLYCRHPAMRQLGLAISYSHRGKDVHADFDKEAAAFIEGIQVPKKPE